jgi:CRISPR-associated protein Csb3
VTHPQPTISLKVDITNPGQFFACCGLLELADRLWPGAEGWFSPADDAFLLAAGGTLDALVDALATATLEPLHPADPRSSPISLQAPFRPLTIDWWDEMTDFTGARDLKVWAGSMEGVTIAKALQHALRDPRFRSPELFDIGVVVKDPRKTASKREPFYFDARRAANAHARDIGFAPNDLGLTTIAHPAVELLCLVGLQVARPSPTGTLHVYDYFTWHISLQRSLVLPAACGQLGLEDARGYRFQNTFRTGEKKHKAFRTAVPLIQGA